MGDEGANRTRIERLKKLAGCLADKELSEKLEIDPSRIVYWKQKGFHESTAKVIDFLLNKTETAKPPKALFTAAELAELTGVAEATIRRLARLKMLPGSEKRKGVWAFTQKAVDHLKVG